MDNTEREQLIRKIREAFTLEEVNSVWRELEKWKRQHPEDIGIEDGFEMLALQRLTFVSVAEPTFAKV